jgi:hypothetical protein
MTIPEAVQLVFHAGEMCEGGEVFLLDMGESIKIIDLAKKMVELSGLSVKNSESEEGDISLVEIGLRPGEKLYEELLIEGTPIATTHPRIFKSRESFIPFSEMAIKVKDIETLFKKEKEYIDKKNVLILESYRIIEETNLKITNDLTIFKTSKNIELIKNIKNEIKIIIKEKYKIIKYNTNIKNKIIFCEKKMNESNTILTDYPYIKKIQSDITIQYNIISKLPNDAKITIIEIDKIIEKLNKSNLEIKNEIKELEIKSKIDIFTISYNDNKILFDNNLVNIKQILKKYEEDLNNDVDGNGKIDFNDFEGIETDISIDYNNYKKYKERLGFLNKKTIILDESSNIINELIINKLKDDFTKLKDDFTKLFYDIKKIYSKLPINSDNEQLLKPKYDDVNKIINVNDDNNITTLFNMIKKIKNIKNNTTKYRNKYEPIIESFENGLKSKITSLITQINDSFKGINIEAKNIIQEIGTKTIINDDNLKISNLVTKFKSIDQSSISTNKTIFSNFIKKYDDNGNKNEFITNRDQLINELDKLGFTNPDLNKLKTLNNNEFDTNKQKLDESFTQFNNNNQFIDGINNTIRFINNIIKKSELVTNSIHKIIILLNSLLKGPKLNAQNTYIQSIIMIAKCLINMKDSNIKSVILRTSFNNDIINKPVSNQFKIPDSIIGISSYTEANIKDLPYKDIKKLEQITKDILLFCKVDKVDELLYK